MIKTLSKRILIIFLSIALTTLFVSCSDAEKDESSADNSPQTTYLLSSEKKINSDGTSDATYYYVYDNERRLEYTIFISETAELKQYTLVHDYYNTDDSKQYSDVETYSDWASTMEQYGMKDSRVTSRYNYYYENGKLIKEGDDSTTTTYYYEEKNSDLPSKSVLQGGETTVTTTYEYDNENKKISETDQWGTTTFSYDSKGNLIEKQRNGNKLISCKYEYDQNGLLTKEQYSDYYWECTYADDVNETLNNLELISNIFDIQENNSAESSAQSSAANENSDDKSAQATDTYKETTDADKNPWGIYSGEPFDMLPESLFNIIQGTYQYDELIMYTISSINTIKESPGNLEYNIVGGNIEGDYLILYTYDQSGYKKLFKIRYEDSGNHVMEIYMSVGWDNDSSFITATKTLNITTYRPLPDGQYYVSGKSLGGTYISRFFYSERDGINTFNFEGSLERNVFDGTRYITDITPYGNYYFNISDSNVFIWDPTNKDGQISHVEFKELYENSNCDDLEMYFDVSDGFMTEMSINLSKQKY